MYIGIDVANVHKLTFDGPGSNYCELTNAPEQKL